MVLACDYIISLTNFYGLVHKRQVLEIYNEQNEEPIEIELLDSFLDMESEELMEYYISNVGDYFVHDAIFNEFWRELDKKRGKPFLVPPKQELLKYKNENYFEHTKQYDELLQHVMDHHKQNKQNAMEVCEDIQGMCELDLLAEEFLVHFSRLGIVFDKKQQLEKIMDLVMKLSRHTRKWSNNGFTLDELMDVEIDGCSESYMGFDLPFSK
jgi:hypothetical protein